jgi:hypothetical protein
MVLKVRFKLGLAENDVDPIRDRYRIIGRRIFTFFIPATIRLLYMYASATIIL